MIEVYDPGIDGYDYGPGVYVDYNPDNRMHANGRIYKRVCDIIIDEGCCNNLISSYVVESLNLRTLPHPRPYVLEYNGEVLEVQRQADVCFSIGDYMGMETCDITPLSDTHMILGEQWTTAKPAYLCDSTNICYFKQLGRRYRFRCLSGEQVDNNKCIIRRQIDEANRSNRRRQIAKAKIEKEGPCTVCGSQTKKKCGNCEIVLYCSEDCQKSHWKAEHKYDCEDFKIVRRSILGKRGGSSVESSVSLLPPEQVIRDETAIPKESIETNVEAVVHDPTVQEGSIEPNVEVVFDDPIVQEESIEPIVEEVLDDTTVEEESIEPIVEEFIDETIVDKESINTTVDEVIVEATVEDCCTTDPVLSQALSFSAGTLSDVIVDTCHQPLAIVPYLSSQFGFSGEKQCQKNFHIPSYDDAMQVRGRIFLKKGGMMRISKSHWALFQALIIITLKCRTMGSIT